MEKEKNLLNRIVPIVLVLIIALVLLNNFMLYERGIKVAEAKAIMEEQLRPAELQFVKITQDNCDFCFDVETIVNELKNQNINITSEETLSSSSIDGREFISKYNIKKLPTIIIGGEIDKSEQLTNYFESKGEIKDDKFIYTSQISPYFETLSNQITGLVKITHIVDSSCEKCTDLSPITSAIGEQGVFIQDEQFIEYNSNEGQELIEKFGVKQIPAVLISEEIDYYSDVKSALIQAGAKEKEEFYVMHSTLPPYRELSQNKIVGLVDVVYLTKDDCPICYDVSVNKNILLRFGMTLKSESTYDISSSEGKQLVQKYNIKKVPVIVLSPDSEYYPSLVQAWKSVGSIEDDGWFIMRNPEVIGTHWNLEENKIVEVGR